MAKTMKAAVLRTLRAPLTIEELPVPEPASGELLIRVTACGVCHSDLHAVEGDWVPLPTLPLIPGHEVAGRVAALGAGVTGFKVGDAVGVPWMYSSCGRCEFCLSGMETICPEAQATGYSKPGGFAEYLVAPAAYVGRLPAEADPYALAPILCAGVTTYRGLKRSQARPGQWVAVIGIGGLGHIAVQYARAMGLRVAAVDLSDDKLALARQIGAEVTVNGATSDAVAEIHRLISGAQAALVVAVAPKAFEQALSMLRPGGTVVYVGIPGGEAAFVRTAISQVVNTELTIRGSSVGTRQDLQEAIDFAAQGLVTASITKARLPEINSVLEQMRRGQIVGRVVLDLA